MSAPDWRRYFQTALRAGHLRASPDYVVRRASCPGQDLLFCLSGAGWIECLGKRHRVAAKQIAWLANERPHAHGADPARPWELLWVRIDGPGLLKLRSLLFAHEPLVLTVRGSKGVTDWFARLFSLLEKPVPRMDLQLHLLIAELFCLLGNCANDSTSQESWIAFPPALLKLLQAIRLHPEQEWPAAKMARVAGISPVQMRRLAALYLHMSPQQWLIRERIALAQNLLAEGSDPVGQIAERCGYGDIYHFSREFKRHAGMSPLAFRKSG